MWSGPVVEPDGTKVYDVSSASKDMGQQYPYTGSVYNEPEGNAVGWNAELCTRLDDGNYWHCEGNLYDLYGCSGQLSFSGVYDDNAYVGRLVITGGTGDFLGAVGSIYSEYDEYSGFELQTITIE